MKGFTIEASLKCQDAKTNLQDYGDLASKCIPAVVHVSAINASNDDEERTDTGSGVFIASDGYIVTNLHIVQSAIAVKVALYDERTLEAKLVGKDGKSDLALIKVELENTPFLAFGDSENTYVGQPVMAIGHPFDLSSTVTSGIICGKHRKLNLLNHSTSIESFLQTDAVLGQGSSGGALVNLKGELIGLNTAVSTSAGAYGGFSFAIPSSIVRKVVNDIKEFGRTQHFNFGLKYRNPGPAEMTGNRFQTAQGIIVEAVESGSPAEVLGIQPGDKILRLDETDIFHSGNFSEMMASKRVADSILVVFNRNGELFTKSAIIEMSAISKEEFRKTNPLTGIKVKSLKAGERSRYKVLQGVQVETLEAGLFRDNTPMKAGFIITKVNNQAISSEAELNAIIGTLKIGDGIMVQGKYPGDSNPAIYAFTMK